MKRFFTGLQPGKIECFTEYLKADEVNTTSAFRGRTTHFNSYWMFKKHSDTILFSQPQRGSTYTINPVAKDVIFNIYDKKSTAVDV